MSINKSTDTIKLQTGLHLYKTGRSQYWYVRILIPKTKKRISRSTEETSRVEAKKVAYEIYSDFMTKPTKYSKIDAPNLFKVYVEKLIDKQKREVETGTKSARFLKDDLKIINREDDGLLTHFSDYPIDKITTSVMRDYFNLLDDNRDKPLASSTKNKHGVILSKTFKMAAEYDAIKEIPLIPNFSVTDNPRVTFEENEYKQFLSSIKKSIESGDVVRGHKVTEEFYYFVLIIVHSYLRPTDREAFALQHKDISPNDDGTINLRVVKGKTGFRQSFSTELGLEFYNNLKRTNSDNTQPNDYLFLPKMKNRTHANRTFQRIFNYVLETHDLKLDQDGQPRTTYSLRHYALQTRLNKSGGKVNIYDLARNAGTSVNQLERFYLKRMKVSKSQRENLNRYDSTE
jgi:hypothetical protein